MRGVRGEGDFGIRNALPAEQAATVTVEKDADERFNHLVLVCGDQQVLAVTPFAGRALCACASTLAG